MQLLMGESEEFGIHEGLKIFPGKVVKFPPTDSEGKKIKVPEIGWEGIYSNRNNWGNSMLKGIDQNEYMYFVHSFYVVPDSKEIILSLSKYEGIEYASSLSKDNIFACQFHPERSAEKGLIIYRNFAQSLKIGGNDDK
jgi:glutamine amidotransferase